MGTRIWDLNNLATDPDFETPAPARIKVLDPMLTTGPFRTAEIIGRSERYITVRVSQLILVGSTVQIGSGELVEFGKVISTSISGPPFEIEVDVQRSS